MLKLPFLFSLFGKKTILSDRFVCLSVGPFEKTLILILPFLNTCTSSSYLTILLRTTHTNSFGQGLILMEFLFLDFGTKS